jgi:hypothetical protein
MTLCVPDAKSFCIKGQLLCFGFAFEDQSSNITIDNLLTNWCAFLSEAVNNLNSLSSSSSLPPHE